MKTETVRMIAEAMSLSENQRVIDLLRQAVMNEETADQSKKELNLYDWVDKKGKRKDFAGIIHQEGWQYVTDGRFLLGIKKPYDEKNEGRVILEDGTPADVTPPVCKQVIPVTEAERTTSVPVDRLRIKAMKEAVKEAEAKMMEELKEAGVKSKTKPLIPVKIGDAYFNPKPLLKIFDFCKASGIDEIYIRYDKYYTKLAKVTEDKVLLLMPLNEPSEGTTVVEY